MSSLTPHPFPQLSIPFEKSKHFANRLAVPVKDRIFKKLTDNFQLNERIEELEYRLVPASQIEKKLALALDKAKSQQHSEIAQAKPSIQPFQQADDSHISLKNKNEWQGTIDLSGRSLNYNTSKSLHHVGIAHTIGRRNSMEDGHIADRFTITAGDRQHTIEITGVFDGHGGANCAKYSADTITQYLTRRLEEYNKNGLTDAGIWNAIKIACADLSRNYKGSSGSTANIALKIDYDLWIANIGDSRAILVDSQGQTTQLSEDAKPADKTYEKSIIKRGGIVLPGPGVPRVNGNLAVARAVGDHGLEGAISSRPKITKASLRNFSGCLVQTCDGITDVATSNTIGAAVTHCLQQKNTPAVTAVKLASRAYHAGSGDNLSAVVTVLGSG